MLVGVPMQTLLSGDYLDKPFKKKYTFLLGIGYSHDHRKYRKVKPINADDNRGNIVFLYF